MYQASNKILLVATNPANGLIYTSFFNGSAWSAWVETGATGDPGKLIDGTDDLAWTANTGGVTMESKKYYYVDMGTYYINWLYVGLKWNTNSFSNVGKWGTLKGIKGKTFTSGDIPAPYFCSVFADDEGTGGHGNVFVKQDGSTYIDCSLDSGYGWYKKTWLIVETFISYK